MYLPSDRAQGGAVCHGWTLSQQPAEQLALAATAPSGAPCVTCGLDYTRHGSILHFSERELDEMTAAVKGMEGEWQAYCRLPDKDARKPELIARVAESRSRLASVGRARTAQVAAAGGGPARLQAPARCAPCSRPHSLPDLRGWSLTPARRAAAVAPMQPPSIVQALERFQAEVKRHHDASTAKQLCTCCQVFSSFCDGWEVPLPERVGRPASLG